MSGIERATCPVCGRAVGTQTVSGTATTVIREHIDQRLPLTHPSPRCAGSRTVVRKREVES